MFDTVRQGVEMYWSILHVATRDFSARRYCVIMVILQDLAEPLENSAS